MYWLYGFSKQIQTVFALTKEGDTKISTLDDLRYFYLHFLAKHQPNTILNNKDLFVDDIFIEDQLFKTFCKDNPDVLRADKKRSLLEKSSTLTQAKDAFYDLKKNNNEIYQLLYLTMHAIVFIQSENIASGSSSLLLGVLWLNFPATFSEIDITELYVHELTHTLLFLDELRYNHYNYAKIRDQNYFTQSAIMHQKRRLDKVLHSIVVAHEILHTRKNFFGHYKGAFKAHPDSKLLLDKTLNSIADVEAQSDIETLLTPRGQEILRDCKTNLLVF
jgi:hypothetical protein